MQVSKNRIQCDLINTTTSKDFKTQSQPKQRNLTPDQQFESTNSVESHTSSERKDQSSEIVKQLKSVKFDFGQQFISCCNDTSERQMIENEDEKFTREVACQSEPNVRHFSIQTHTPKEKVTEQAEIAVQVEPSVFSISTQYSSFGARSNTIQQFIKRTKNLKRPPEDELHSANIAKKTKSKFEISKASKSAANLNIESRITGGTLTESDKVDNFEQNDIDNVCIDGPLDVDKSESNDVLMTELVSATNDDCNTETESDHVQDIENAEQMQPTADTQISQSVAVPEADSSTASMYLPPGCNYVELDYSNIPADILQQILLKTNPSQMVGSQQEMNNAMESVGEGLKAMYFIVDGAHGEGSNTGQVLENKTAQQMILQQNVLQQNKVKCCFKYRMGKKIMLRKKMCYLQSN